MRIFVGYGGSSAKKVALKFFDLFQENGWEPFIAPEETSIGPWEPSVLGALKKADVFTVVYARGSWKSQMLAKELVLAEEWKISIYPIVERRIDKNDASFPTVLRNSQITRYDAKRQSGSFREVTRKLRRIQFGLPYTTIADQGLVPRNLRFDFSDRTFI